MSARPAPAYPSADAISSRSRTVERALAYANTINPKPPMSDPVAVRSRPSSTSLAARYAYLSSEPSAFQWSSFLPGAAKEKFTGMRHPKAVYRPLFEVSEWLLTVSLFRVQFTSASNALGACVGQQNDCPRSRYCLRLTLLLHGHQAPARPRLAIFCLFHSQTLDPFLCLSPLLLYLGAVVSNRGPSTRPATNGARNPSTPGGRSCSGRKLPHGAQRDRSRCILRCDAPIQRLP
jgi:hypothetical protein